jgi:hypothetical protein
VARLRDVHGGEIRSIRQPLLSALDLEYVRAANKKDTARMGEIMTIMELLNNLWPEKIPLSVPSGAPVLAMPAPSQLPPAPLSQMGPRPGWVREVIKAATVAPPDPLEQPPPPEMTLPEALQPKVDDAAARRAAKARIEIAAQRFSFNTAEQQMEYETALLAHNRNVEAMSQLEPRAKQMGMTVTAMAEVIITQWTARARKLMQIKTIMDRINPLIDAATGEEIHRLEGEAVAQIQGDSQ